VRLAPPLAAMALAAATLASVLAGCGGGGDKLTVSAATSLKAPLAEYAGDEVNLSFGGSDQLAAQIRAGARPDVFVSADEELPAALHREGLVERPVRVGRNRLVVAVAEGGRVRRFEDLARPGIRIAAGAPSVPVGAYARRALPEAAERNIVSQEPDVGAVVARVRSGAVDAGLVYATDVAGLRAIEPPKPVEAVYAAAVVEGTEDRERARRFVRGLAGGPGREALERAGFRPPAP
jgi:molybdate transport system substrate-binding protein